MTWKLDNWEKDTPHLGPLLCAVFVGSSQYPGDAESWNPFFMRGISSAKSLLWEGLGFDVLAWLNSQVLSESAAAAKLWVLRDGNHWLQCWLSKQLFCTLAAVEFLFLPFSRWLLIQYDSLSCVIIVTLVLWEWVLLCPFQTRGRLRFAQGVALAYTCCTWLRSSGSVLQRSDWQGLTGH